MSLTSQTFGPGLVAAAFWVPAVSLRAWHAEPLGLQCDGDVFRPRRKYSLADCARIGLVAKWAHAPASFMGLKAAIELANLLRPAFAAELENYDPDDIFERRPVAVAERLGYGEGWRVGYFRTVGEMTAAMLAVPHPDIGVHFPLNIVVVDIHIAISAARAALSRPGVQGIAE